MNASKIVISFLAAVAAVGCASDVEESGEPLAQISSPIRMGTLAGGNGVVEFGGCSGIAVGSHMILTASHCFDGDLGSNGMGMVNARINYAITGDTFQCMTGEPSNGKCTEDRPVWVYRLTGIRAPNDLAMVVTEVPGGSWTVSGAPGFYTGGLGVGQQFDLYGTGPNSKSGSGSGLMRRMTDSYSEIQVDQFNHLADSTTRVCLGDSGGAYVFPGTNWIMGIQSGCDTLDGSCCAYNTKVWGARIDPAKKDQINAWRYEEGLPACTQHSAQYPDFWVCD